ncbi:MAG: IS200/IS605 family transposase [Thermomicrobiales bacterium]
MPYWQLFYHVVWATKQRAPLLTADIAPLTHDLLKQKALALGARVFAVNGVEDHVHMVVAIPPKIAVARFVGQVKATAATQVNKLVQREKALAWQEEYGVFSLDGKRLPNHIAYVERQQEHHAANTTIPLLERTGSQQTDSKTLRESTAPYLAISDDWWQELMADDQDSDSP